MGLKNEALTWRMDPVTKLNISSLSNIFWASAAAPKWPKGIFPGLRPSTIIQKCLWYVIFGISWDKHSYDMLFLAYHETMTHHEAQQAGRAKKTISFFIRRKPSKLGSLKSCGLHHSLPSYYTYCITPSLTWNCPIGWTGHSGHWMSLNIMMYDSEIININCDVQ